MRYQTRGTCSTAIDLEIENDVITHCQFTNGCRGNTQGLAKMVEGQNAKRRDEPSAGHSVPGQYLLPGSARAEPSSSTISNTRNNRLMT